MCSPTLFMAGSAGFSAMGSISGGNADRAQANYQAAQEDYQARVAQDDALAQADIIRKSARRTKAEASAAYAGAGVKVGEGSAEEVDRQIGIDSEHDAAMAILTGNRRARGLNQDAEMTRLAGRNAARSGVVKAFGTALSAGYQISSGWRTAPIQPASGSQFQDSGMGMYGYRRSN